MAKYVIYGQADCPNYARAELLADDLSFNLPDFKVHKETISQDKWQMFLEEICKKNGWTHNTSPLIYRELVDRGGNGTYLGDFKAFQTVAKHWYGFDDIVGEEAQNIAKENLEAHLQLEKDRMKEHTEPVKFAIIGAGNPVAYQLLPLFLGGFFDKKPKSFVLCDTNDKFDALQGVQMELEDLSVDDYHSTLLTDNMTSAVTSADYVIILEDIDALKYEECFSLLHYTNEFYKSIAESIKGAISTSTKIVLSGYKACVGAQLLKYYDVKSDNITVVMTLDEQRVRSKLSKQLQVHPEDISQITVWGNVPLTDSARTTLGQVKNHLGSLTGPPWHSKSVSEAVVVPDWDTANMEDKTTRDTEIMSKCERGPFMSTALAIYRHIHALVNGSDFFTMGIESKGEFDTDHGVFLGVPVSIDEETGCVKVKQDVELSEEIKELIRLQNNQLIVEKQIALSEHEDISTALQKLEEALWRVVVTPSLGRQLEDTEALRIAAEEEARIAAEKQAIEEEKKRQEEEAIREAEAKAAALLADDKDDQMEEQVETEETDGQDQENEDEDQ